MLSGLTWPPDPSLLGLATQFSLVWHGHPTHKFDLNSKIKNYNNFGHACLILL